MLKSEEKNKKAIIQTSVGITLIALVITIIVLLILSGVTIATLTSENGILKQAERAKENTEIGEEKEVIKLAYNGAVAEKNGDTKITAEEINNQFEKNATNAEAKGSIKIHFSESNRWYKLDSNGNILGPYTSEEEIKATLAEMFMQAQNDNCEGGEECTNLKEHLHIGDYVEYNPIATGETLETKNQDGTLKYQYESLTSKNGYTNLEKQIYSVNNDTEKVNWIVLGISEDGNNLLITTGSPVRKEGTNNPENDDPYLYLYGSTGYINLESELNNISSIYGKGDYAIGARSITVEDINKLTGYIPQKEKYGESELYEYGNTVSVKGNGDGTYSWNSATNGYQNGNFNWDHSITGFGYIKNNELKNISITDGKTIVDLTSTYYHYETKSYVNNNRIINCFFNTGNNNYWLASPIVNISTNFIGFGVRFVNQGFVRAYGIFNSYGNRFYQEHGVRPVVVLQATVTQDEIAILEEQTNPVW